MFSFYSTKNVTCGDGGVIILKDAALPKNTVEARLHGMSAIADRFLSGKYNHWDMNRLGTKANLPDLSAALLPKQIGSSDKRCPSVLDLQTGTGTRSQMDRCDWLKRCRRPLAPNICLHWASTTASTMSLYGSSTNPASA